MTRTGWMVTVFAPAVLVVAASSAVFRPSAGVSGTPVSQVSPSPSEPVTVGRPMGQSSCSSVGCHGGGVGGPDAARWMSSAHEWHAADPHRRAFAVLSEPLAVAMMARLFPGEPEKQRATEDARCLACHTNPALAAATDPHSVSLRREGVSCEACHGNAGGWLGPHTGFNQNRDAGYTTSGMAKLYDLGERALACAGCHVGAPAGNGLPLRDMNHDMIAAGHPRLNFDFATYQFLLPRHWNERDRSTGAADPDFEARAWLVGRVAHAEAACNLTADRAKRADPWPEFAEYSCVACHHRVGDKSAEYPAPTGRPLGSLPWQLIWPITRANSESVGPTRGLQAALATRSPDAVKTAAAEAATELASLRAAYLGRADRLSYAADLMKRTVDARPELWSRDLTEQVYHGAAAIARARIARGVYADTESFAAAAKLLTLPRGTVRFDLPLGAAKTVRALVK